MPSIPGGGQLPAACPQCGAALAPGESCMDRFNAGQLLELEQPERYAAHHLSVPCYMLQHNAYSREGWLEVRSLLDRFINGGWTPAMARRQARVYASSRVRTWSFTRGPKPPGVEQIRWQFTVADVRLDSPEHYCADVRRWARAILDDSEGLMRALPAKDDGHNGV